MKFPRRYWRFCTGQAQGSLAERFGLANEDWMQDWEYIVSDSERIDEFLAAYEHENLSEDERFCLMELIVDSFGWWEFEPPSARWLHTLDLIEQNLNLHAHTICYWACLDYQEDELGDAFEAAPFMRAILERHSAHFGYPFSESELEEDGGAM